MLVSDLVFDALLFGALLLGGVLDGLLPATHGAASLVAVGAATYLAAQEASHALEKRGIWTQESLWSSLSLCLLGFIYYWWRNQSDLILLGLSISLMLASLMLAIGFISGLSAAWRSGGTALGGLVVTMAGALLLGALAGALVLALSQPASILPLALKLGLVAFSLVVWKAREKMRPPHENATPATLTSAAAPEAPTVANIYGVKASPSPVAAPTPTPVTHRSLIPRRGSVLDRFAPALVLGAGLLMFALSGSRLAEPISPRVIAQPSASDAPFAPSEIAPAQ
jgi:hypothetical protein